MYILTDKEYKIIDILDAIEIVDLLWIRLSKGSLIQLDNIIVSEVESVPVNANYYKDGKFTKRHPDIVKKDVEAIQEQLNDIDKKSVRDTEDLYDLLVKKGLVAEADVPYLKQRKDQKKQLREALKNIT